MAETYLCTYCDNVFDSGTKIEDVVCMQCGKMTCVYAININEGTRKRWIAIENGSKWKRFKKIRRSLKHDLCNDPLWSERLDNITDEIFAKFNENEVEDFFPKYRVDYPRTIGKKNKLRKSDHRTKTKRGTIRGELYEGFFNRVIDTVDNIERCNERIVTPNGKSCRPDALISFGPRRKFPVEFKTIMADSFTVRNLKKMLIQARTQGTYADLAGYKNSRSDSFGISMLIVCSPEDRTYSSFLIDSRIEGKLSHLKGQKSKKRISREKNKAKQLKDREYRLQKKKQKSRKEKKRNRKNE